MDIDKFWAGLAGVVVGVVLTVLKDYLNEWRSKKSDARYLAVRIISLLDRFSDSCIEVTEDDGFYDENGYRTTRVSNPSLKIDTIDGRWQSLSFELMYEVLDFPNELARCNEQIDIAAERGDGLPDYLDYFNERKLQYSILGLKAIKLSSQLRTKYSIKLKSYDEWDPVTYFIKLQKLTEDYKVNRTKAIPSKKGQP